MQNYVTGFLLSNLNAETAQCTRCWCLAVLAGRKIGRAHARLSER